MAWIMVNKIIQDYQSIDIHGINPWKFKWNEINGEYIIVSHPQYPDQKHKFNIYTIENGDKKIKFAAGEFSNGAWGFYIQNL